MFTIIVCFVVAQDIVNTNIPGLDELLLKVEKETFSEQLDISEKLLMEYNSFPTYQEVAKLYAKKEFSQDNRYIMKPKITVGIQLKYSVKRLLEFGIEQTENETLSADDLELVSGWIVKVGIAQYKGGDFYGAKTTFETLLPLHKNTALEIIDLYYMAVSLQTLNLTDDALAFYDRAINHELFMAAKSEEVLKYCALTMWDKAELLYALGRTDESKTMFEHLFVKLTNSPFSNILFLDAYYSYEKKFRNVYHDEEIHPFNAYYAAMYRVVENEDYRAFSAAESELEHQNVLQALYLNRNTLNHINLYGGPQ
ncbi:MAG: hypothetical protein CSA81_12675 [Acidobacteria bacterium]|nr:MAG: hypothetical protein CSA81_12675 [Acidobacteriota bacterium]